MVSGCGVHLLFTFLTERKIKIVEKVSFDEMFSFENVNIYNLTTRKSAYSMMDDLSKWRETNSAARGYSLHLILLSLYLIVRKGSRIKDI